MKRKGDSIAIIAVLLLSFMVVTTPGQAASGLTKAAPADCSPAWSVVPSPHPGRYNQLYAVAAISPGDVWAVGEQYTATTQDTLVEHWDGSSWSVVPSPDPGSFNVLSSVAAVSSSDVWAVGEYAIGSAHSVSLTEHWDGMSWSVVPNPNLGTEEYELNSVAVVASNDVWAVGYDAQGDGAVALTEHWDGTSWSVVPSPDPGSINDLRSVAALSSNDVWTVGEYSSSSGHNHTMAEHWDGTSWSVVPSPNPDPNRDSNHLYAVAALSANEVWAVGDTRDQTNTLVEHYTASGCGSPVPTNCPAPFLDISNDIFRNAIAYLVCQGAVNGTSNIQYSPASTATRGQFAKVVVLAFGLPIYTPTSGQDFTDVAPSYFAYRNIETGYHAGILSGFDANTCTAYGAQSPCYLPNLAITRGQTTALVVSAAHFVLVTPTSGNPSFTDVPASNVFFVTIETAYAHGLIDGYPDRTFRPNNSIRRDEMAQIVYTGITAP